MGQSLLENSSLCCLIKLPLSNLPVQCLLCIALTTKTMSLSLLLLCFEEWSSLNLVSQIAPEFSLFAIPVKPYYIFLFILMLQEEGFHNPSSAAH